MIRVLLLPSDDVPAQNLNGLAEEIKRTVYGAKVAIATEPLNLLEGTLDRARGQHLADEVLARVARGYGGPLNTVCLGVTSADLYAPTLNFVFGKADPLEGVAVVSTYRLEPHFYGKPKDKDLLGERTLKEAIHEIGHLLGLSHCKDAKCVMRFSNSIAEVDAKGNTFCSQCAGRVRAASSEEKGLL